MCVSEVTTYIITVVNYDGSAPNGSYRDYSSVELGHYLALNVLRIKAMRKHYFEGANRLHNLQNEINYHV